MFIRCFFSIFIMNSIFNMNIQGICIIQTRRINKSQQKCKIIEEILFPKTSKYFMHQWVFWMTLLNQTFWCRDKQSDIYLYKILCKHLLPKCRPIMNPKCWKFSVLQFSNIKRSFSISIFCLVPNYELSYLLEF